MSDPLPPQGKNIKNPVFAEYFPTNGNELTAAILLPMLQHSSPILVTVVRRKMLVQAKGDKSSHFQNSKKF